MKLKYILPALLVAPLAFPTLAQDQFQLDPDGLGPDGVVTADLMDFNPSNTIGIGGVSAIGQGVGGEFTVLVHSTLTNLQLGGQVVGGLGLTQDYEITIVMGFGQRVVNSIDTNGDGLSEFAQFELDPTSSVNFVEIWQGDIDADDLSGTGFNNGTRILEGIVVANSGYFNVSDFSPSQFDQFPSLADNNYPGQGSVTGAGVDFPLTIQVTYSDLNYFMYAAGDVVTLDGLNVSQIVPFRGANPSALFVGAAGGGAPTVVPDLGAVNGLNGPDIQFQTDFNIVAQVADTPPPGSCRMTGGGVFKDGSFDNGDLADMGRNITFGGQVGAPSTAPPEGQWQHNQHGKDKFAFHVPTILSVDCFDPGVCLAARPAFFKQMDWTGIGTFNSVSGFDYPVGQNHYVKAHIEDIGEPGPGGKQPKSDSCGRIPNSGLIDETTDCTNCPDVYLLEVHETEDPASPVIYSTGGFISNGNLQIHPEIN